jgi:polar amino acid transport system permease protein
MADIGEWFRRFYESTGINLTYMYDDFDRARMLKGLWLTIELALITIVLSILVGILGAWLQGSRFRLLRILVDGFISLFRNTPPLVQIYFFYFGLGYLLPRFPTALAAQRPF